jgi:predicted short-subunit dehydrogenase-like oxidoreductase (DUF2520 family)
MYNMKIGITGTGNVAAVLGRKAFLAGHHIVQVCGRDQQKVKALALEWGAQPGEIFERIDPAVELMLIALKDDVLYELPADWATGNAIVAHTAGSVPLEVLFRISTLRGAGVFYPLQSLRKEMKKAASLPDIPIFLESKDERVMLVLKELANTIGSEVHEADGERRKKLHLGAVLVSNFTNHLYHLAHQYFQKEKLPFHALLPLMKETVERLQNYTPGEVQTGPAARGDLHTMEVHRLLLKEMPHLLGLYDTLNQSIQRAGQIGNTHSG